MSQPGAVEVVDRDGWRKEFTLQKTLVYIGSDPRGDVVLDNLRGAGVSPRHLQLIAASGSGQGYRLINMGDTEIGLAEGDGWRSLPPRAVVEVGDGQRIKVGDFTLTFRGGAGPGGAMGADATSSVVGLTLTLPQTQLTLDQPLDGSVTVRNLGDQASVQFNLQVDGLDPGSFEIGPGPILFPHAEKEVFFRLFHPKAANPPAGEYRLRVRATAPLAYPGQSATASQVIQITPYYSHQLRVVTPEGQT